MGNHQQILKNHSMFLSPQKQFSPPLLLILCLLASLWSCQTAPSAEPTIETETETEAENSDQNVVVIEPSAEPTAIILVENLINPVGLDPLPDGSLLIAEEGTGANDDSAGVTLRLPNGEVGRLISGIPSGRDAGDLSGVPFAKWQDGILYTSFFNHGRLATLPLDLDGPLSLPLEPYRLEDLGETMVPLNAVQLRNPFDLTFDNTGVPIVTDATENGVAILTDRGHTRFFHRFDDLKNPGEGKPEIEAVPTGITRYGRGREYLVTLFTGCPYPAGGGQLVAIDSNRGQRTLLDGLNMPIDVAVDTDGTIWLLEFARFSENEGAACFSGEGYLPYTGLLSKIDRSGRAIPVLTDLNFPGAIAFDAAGNLLLSEIFSGRVVQVSHLNQLATETSLPTLLGETVADRTEEVSSQNETGFELQFENVAAQVGLDFRHGAFTTGEITADPVAMMGAGLCWLDYNNDGWLDLYLVNSYAEAEGAQLVQQGALPTNQLFQNEEGRFIDVSRTTRSDLTLRGNGCVAADLNLDGWTDIYITADGPNALLWNQGDGSFVEAAAIAGVDLPDWNSAAAVGDINRDGWPDLFVAAYIDLELTVDNPVGAFPQDFLGLPDTFFINNGDGTFRDVTDLVGLEREERGLGAVFSDFDIDGDLDLYIANDGHPNRLYTCVPDDSEIGFHFADASLSSGTNDSGSGMGVAIGDYDNNALLDILVTNWDTELNALYRNQLDELDELQFRYSTFQIGITGLGNNLTGWGTAWVDFDNDSDEDLLVVNGHVPIGDLVADAQLVRLYGNQLVEGKPREFRDWTQRVGFGEGALGPLMARGSAVADFDNDGDVDIAVNQIGGPAVLLENQGTRNAWLGVIIPDGRPGTRIELTLADGSTQIRELRSGSSYLASEDPRAHFGLGGYGDGPISITILEAGEEPRVHQVAGANRYVTLR